MTHRVETRNLLSSSFGASHQVKIHRFGTEGARPKVYLQAALRRSEGDLWFLLASKGAAYFPQWDLGFVCGDPEMP